MVGSALNVYGSSRSCVSLYGYMKEWKIKREKAKLQKNYYTHIAVLVFPLRFVAEPSFNKVRVAL